MRKKKPCDTEMRRQSSYGRPSPSFSRHRPFACQTYTTRTGTGNAHKNWGTDIERTTTDKGFFFFFFFSIIFLDLGMKYELVWEIWLDWFLFRYMGYIRFWFDFLKFGVIHGLGLERARQKNKRECEFAIWKEHW